MGKRKNMDSLDELFQQGKDFKMAEEVYKEKTGNPFPKGKWYLKKQSALARKAAEYGFEIVEIIEKPVIVKTVVFKKK